MQSSELSKKDYEVLNFLLKYKMLKVEDASLIYKTKRYYRERKEWKRKKKEFDIIKKIFDKKKIFRKMHGERHCHLME